MKEILDIYYQNKDYIENFLQETLDTNFETLENVKKDNYKKLYNIFVSLELVYIVDKDSKKQISENIFRGKSDKSRKGESRDYLIKKLQIDENIDTGFTKPYKSGATKNMCITMSKKEGNKIYFFDFNLITLLQRLELIDANSSFRKMTKTFYAITGFSMVFLSLFIVIYAMYSFGSSFLSEEGVSIESIFKPIIALTLGLAIFDLAKTVLEQEVFFKSYSQNSKLEVKTLTKFLISIIIALSIEALMVVFKIAIENYDKMINAFYLISGVSIFIISLSIFVYLTKKKKA